jgi:hypothetical protein
MTSCNCKDRTHPHHRDEPCENIASEPSGLCKVCASLGRVTRKQGVMGHDLAALLDAFAELRRTWDELVGLQPDIITAGAPLSDTDLALFSERVSAHVVAAVALEDQIEIMRADKGGI